MKRGEQEVIRTCSIWKLPAPLLVKPCESAFHSVVSAEEHWVVVLEIIVYLGGASQHLNFVCVLISTGQIKPQLFYAEEPHT